MWNLDKLKKRKKKSLCIKWMCKSLGGKRMQVGLSQSSYQK